MIRPITIFIFFLTIVSCKNDGPSKQEYEQLKKELEDYKKTVADLQNTPEKRLIAAQESLANKNYATAHTQFQEIIAKFPGTAEAKTAANELVKIEDLQKKQKETEEKKKTLGFKALKENTKFNVGDVQISFLNVSTSSQWTFDSYGDEWHYRGAERGNKYVIARVSITTENKDPNLPPISVYKMANGQLNLIGTMGYEFVRWKDYGSYLGNYADYRNDFTYTGTIPFSCGIQITNSDLDNTAAFVVVKKTNCFSRIESRFDNPPVSYSELSCNVKQSLTVEDFDNDYVVVKIFNKGKL